MSFTVEQFEDLLRLLRERPEWRQRLLEVLLTEELLKLPAEFKAFRAEALDRFDRLEKAIEELIKAQARTEERVGQVEDRLSRVEEAVARLAEAQARTEEEVAALIQAIRTLEARLGGVERELGRLRNDIGLQTENVAADVVEYLLGRKGYRPISRPGPLEADGELDLVWAVESPAGERLWVVAEAKYRLKAEDVLKFAQRFRSRGFRERLKAAGIPGPYLPYVFGIAADIRADEQARQLGIGLITARGEVIAPAGPET
jgi:tetratricopeptide (TPR) repeat protein